MITGSLVYLGQRERSTSHCCSWAVHGAGGLSSDPALCHHSEHRASSVCEYLLCVHIDWIVLNSQKMVRGNKWNDMKRRALHCETLAALWWCTLLVCQPSCPQPHPSSTNISRCSMALSVIYLLSFIHHSVEHCALTLQGRSHFFACQIWLSSAKKYSYTVCC